MVAHESSNSTHGRTFTDWLRVLCGKVVGELQPPAPRVRLAPRVHAVGVASVFGSRLDPAVQIRLHPRLQGLGYTPRDPRQPYAVAVTKGGRTVAGWQALQALYDSGAVCSPAKAVSPPDEHFDSTMTSPTIAPMTRQQSHAHIPPEQVG